MSATERPRVASGRVARWLPHLACGAVLALVFSCQAASIRGATSATFDESIYLRLAARLARDGSFADLVGRGVAPLPVLLAHVPPAVARVGDRSPQPLDRDPVVARERGATRFAARIEASRRIHAWLVGVPLLLFVYGWMARRRGVAAGLLAGALVALSPTVVAHAAIATTDACLALGSLVGLAALAAYSERPSARRWLLVGLAFGLALAMKYSAIFLFAVALVALAVPARARDVRVGRPTGAVLVVAGWVLVALTVAWAGHGFAVLPLFAPDAAPVDFQRVFGTGPFANALLMLGRETWIPAPLKGLQRQAVHGLLGQPAFLNGEVSLRGWWSYFPLALSMKSTPVELLLGLLAAAGLGAKLVRGGTADREPRLWWLALVVLLAFAIASPLDTGVRYVLVAYPLVVLLGVDALAGLARRHARLFAAIGASLVALQALSAARISPHHLAYFNILWGGPERGHLHLVDSNLDWGQDLPALATLVRERGIRELRCAYFGTAPLAAYGVTALAWADPAEPAEGSWLAVSATHLQGLYLGGDPFAALRALAPDARAGYGIFLYDLGRADVRGAYDEARRQFAPMPASDASAETHSTG